MTEAEWLACTEPGPMLEFRRRNATCRQLRLFAVACCRRFWSRLDPNHVEELQRAIELAERFIEKQATYDECGATRADLASRTLSDQTIAIMCALAPEIRDTAVAGANAALSAMCYREELVVPERRAQVALLHDIFGPLSFRSVALDPSVLAGLVVPERRAQVALLHDVFGSLPFHPVTVPPDVLAWNDRLVPRLAQAIYVERRWGDMPILSDALLDAGCGDEEILAHCRAGGEHVRGCWVIDLLLGRQ